MITSYVLKITFFCTILFTHSYGMYLLTFKNQQNKRCLESLQSSAHIIEASQALMHLNTQHTTNIKYKIDQELQQFDNHLTYQPLTHAHNAANYFIELNHELTLLLQKLLKKFNKTKKHLLTYNPKSENYIHILHKLPSLNALAIQQHDDYKKLIKSWQLFKNLLLDTYNNISKNLNGYSETLKKIQTKILPFFTHQIDKEQINSVNEDFGKLSNLIKDSLDELVNLKKISVVYRKIPIKLPDDDMLVKELLSNEQECSRDVKNYSHLNVLITQFNDIKKFYGVIDNIEYSNYFFTGNVVVDNISFLINHYKRKSECLTACSSLSSELLMDNQMTSHILLVSYQACNQVLLPEISNFWFIKNNKFIKVALKLFYDATSKSLCFSTNNKYYLISKIAFGYNSTRKKI